MNVESGLWPKKKKGQRRSPEQDWLRGIFKSELRWNAKLVASVLADHVDAAGECYPSQAQLISFTGISEPSVKRGVKDLLGAGWIEIQRPTELDGKGHWKYVMGKSRRYGLLFPEGFSQNPSTPRWVVSEGFPKNPSWGSHRTAKRLKALRPSGEEGKGNVARGAREVPDVVEVKKDPVGRASTPTVLKDSSHGDGNHANGASAVADSPNTPTTSKLDTTFDDIPPREFGSAARPEGSGTRGGSEIATATEALCCVTCGVPLGQARFYADRCDGCPEPAAVEVSF